MKRKFKIILSLLLATCLCFAVGCKNKSNSNENKPITYSLSATQCTVKCFEEYQLSIITTGEIGNVEWVSLNKNVATVIDGKVIAQSVGSSVVKAVFDGRSLSCLVNVVSNDKVPSIFLDDDSYSLVKDGHLKITPKVMFDGKLYEDGEFTFEVDNQNICEIQDGKIIGKEYGKTTLRIFGEWRGAESVILVKEVPLSVKRDATILLSQSNFELFTENQVAGTESFAVEKQISSTLFVENAVDNSKTVVWECSDQELITVENGLVKVNSNGKTGVAYVWAQVQTSEIDVVSDKIKVTVSKPILDKTEQVTLIHDMSERAQAVDAVKVFGTNENVVSVVDAINPTVELFNNGKAEYYSKAASQREWIVSAKTYSVKVLVNCVTKVLRTAKDIDDMDNLAKPESYSDKSMNSFSGWFILGNDIDYGGRTYVSEVTLSGGFGGVWASGILDGQGYNISNITFTGNGFFGVRALSIVLKNISITGAKLTGARANVVTGQLYRTSVIENVFVQATSTVGSGTKSNVLVGALEDAALSKITNVVVDIESATNADHISGITKTSTLAPKLSVFNAVYTLGAKVNIGADVNADGVYDETDSKNNTYLANASENNVSYVGGAYETDSEFLSEQNVFTGEFAKVFALASENGQTVLKFMGRTVKVFDTVTA